MPKTAIRARRSVRAQITLFACLIASGVAAAILLISYIEIRQISLDKAETILREETALAAVIFANEIASIEQDILILSQTPPIQGIARSLENDGIDYVDGSSLRQWRERLQHIFLAKLRHRPEYLQLRLIGLREGGRELVRVDVANGSLRAVTQDELQQKGGEPYFIEALTAGEPNQVLFTDVSYNRENGLISQPPTLVLRAIMPVSDDNGAVFGFLIINVDYLALLHNALDRLDVGTDVAVVNSQGDYIIRRARDGGTEFRFHDAPGAAPAPEAALIGTLKPGDPPAEYRVAGRDILLAYERVHAGAKQANNWLGIALLQDRGMLLADSSAASRKHLALSVFLVIAVSLLAWWISRSFTSPVGQIIGGIRAYSGGDPLPPLPVDRPDELGELSRSFATLTRQLEATRRAETRTSKRLEAISENTIDGLISIDTAGTIIDYNSGCETIFGYSAAEAIGRNVSLLMPPHTAQAHDGYLENYLAGHPMGIVGETRDVVGRAKDGRDVPIELSVSEIQLDEGTVFSGILRDVSDRKRFETALAEREETFRRAMHDAPTGMALVRPDGSWIDLNQALCDLFGYSRAELLRMHFIDLTHPDDLGIVEPNRDKLARGEIQNYRFEKRYLHKSGRTVWAYLSVSSMKRSNGETMLICHLHDISESKRMEEMKSEFVSVVSHELRTPLTSIRGSLGLMLGAMDGELTPGVRRLVSIAYANCERLIPLINDILDLDKIAAGKMRFDIKPVAVTDLIDKSVTANAAYAEKFGVTIVSEPIPPGCRVMADEERGEQVLANLLSNAAKFTPEGGTVTVRAGNADGMVRISVTDEGDGVPEEFADKIFEKFTQADSSVARGVEGTGLGLHISKQIIERMSGRIGYDSITGVGATFWFELPQQGAVPAARIVTSAPDNGDTATADDGHATPLPRILHVEDDADFIRVLGAGMQDHCHIEAAFSIAQARACIAEGDYDLIILDPGLPDGNALDLLPIRGGPITPETRVVVLGSDHLPDGIASAVDAAFVKSRISEAALRARLLDCLATTPKRAANS